MNIIKFKPIIIIVIFGISCNKPATKNNSALLSLFITQTSGNCAVIELTLREKPFPRQSPLSLIASMERE
jgi:hypothetical protein